MRRARGISLVDLFVMICFIAVLAAIFVPNFTRRRGCGSPLTACKSNLKNIGTAVEMYYTDWGGAYPPSLGVVTPNYLRTLPTCPGAGSDTYSAGYFCGEPEPMISCPAKSHRNPRACEALLAKQNRLLRENEWEGASSPLVCPISPGRCPEGSPYSYWPNYLARFYCVYCRGQNHPGEGLPPGYPQFDNLDGLLERPMEIP